MTREKLFEEPQEVDGDTAALKFPKEFEDPDTGALMTAEVFKLLDHRRETSEADQIDDIGVIIMKTLNYTRRFSRFKNREAIRAARGIFHGAGFHKFEEAQLLNLCPESAEEAKTLIPSLKGKIADDELEEMLKELNQKRSFQ